MKIILRQNYTVILALALGLGGGICLQRFYFDSHKAPELAKIKAAGSHYQYISPLLAVDIADTRFFPEYNKLEDSLNEIINNYKSDKDVKDASVYFRNLNNGSWVGINENENYNPGSLLKVPIMLAYLKMAESDPSVLSAKVKFDNPKDQSAPQMIPPAKQIEFGKTYTIEDLIGYMIVYSDNNAANLLAEKIYLDQKNSYTEMLGDLSLPSDLQTLSVKQYSMFLRILYNSTYLSRTMSEKALSIMAAADFRNGLVAGLPDGVAVAHKFGEYGETEDGKVIEQLHDCGIIYTNKPYLLCVMTKGADEPTLEHLISDISKQVYLDTLK